MLSAISLIAAISAEVSMAAVVTEDSGTINLSLQLTADQTLTATPASGFNDNVTLTTTDNTDGTRTMDDKLLGDISFSGDNIPNGSYCNVTFKGSHDASSYRLANANANDMIEYQLNVGNIEINSLSSSIASITPVSEIHATLVENSSNLKTCDINITNLTVKSVNQDLTGKNGTYTDTITYTITVI